MKALWINAAQQSIEEVAWSDIHDLHELVGGWLEIAMLLPHGDVLYVDEDGKLKESIHTGFTIGGSHELVLGNGVVVGKERINEDGEQLDPLNEDPKLTLSRLKDMVLFAWEVTP